MMTRLLPLLILLLASFELHAQQPCSSWGTPQTGSLPVQLASVQQAGAYRSENFVVYAAHQDVAQYVAECAEKYRKDRAEAWLGKELPRWSQPCTISVRLADHSGAGATTFDFRGGQILSQQMTIEGRYDRIIRSVLPHEVTHTIFAAHFRGPVPRWADEGGAMCEEDEPARAVFDGECKRCLETGRKIPLRTLLGLRDYPRDGEGVLDLYAQGYQTARFLLAIGGRPRFLEFVAAGQSQGWDAAARSVYGFQDVDAMEAGWTDYCIGKLFGLWRQRRQQQNPQSPVVQGQPLAPSAPSNPIPADPFSPPTPPAGLQVQPGPQGSAGPQGPQGPAGPQGLPGKDATVNVDAITQQVTQAVITKLQMQAILYDAQGNPKQQVSFGPGQPLRLKLVPVTPSTTVTPSK